MRNLFKFTDKENEKFIRLNLQKDIESLEFILGDPRGRWFLAQLGAWNFFYDSTFTGSSATFFNEGRRAVAVNIYDKIETSGEINADKLADAMTEWKKERRHLAKMAKGQEGGCAE